MLRKLTGRRGETGRSLYLAAFGKHPGWDDHIADLGLETDRLIEAKRVLYVEGIGGNVDAGAWDELEPEQCLESFHHAFVSFQDDGWILGRLWSSTDGKGRSRYPMVVCAECRGLDFRAAGPSVFDRLEGLEAACRSTQESPVVTSLLTTARGELRARFLNRQPALPGPGAVRHPLAILANRPELGQQWTGLVRLLYHVDHNLASWSSHGSRTKRKTTRSLRIPTRGEQVRVPRCADSPMDALILWAGFLADQLARGVPLWVICPLDVEGWVDLLVGPATTSEFVCLRMLPAALPLTSDVPYKMDEEYVERTRRLIEERLRGGQAASG